jgi:predicted O-methyltransferase YrrM
VRFLDLWLKPTDRAFEWGSGRSTLWIAKRVHSIISVEHNAAWFKRVRSRATMLGLENVKLLLRGQDGSGDRTQDYVSAIDEVDQRLDLVIVDGIHRDVCALAALRQLKPSGLLLIDNVNWYLPSPSRSPSSRSEGDGPESPAWKEFGQKVAGWRLIWTTNGVCDTGIWVKPLGIQGDRTR